METSVGDSIEAPNGEWNFGGNVPVNFITHVRKSVPFYEEGHDLILKLSDYYVSDESICYDIGCSTGALTQKLYERHANKAARIIGIDSEPDMISYAIKNNSHSGHVDYVNADIAEYDIEKADLIVAYYTIQFIKPRIRQDVFDKIYHSLNWGGAFILFEKVRSPDARFQDQMTSIYTDYKLGNGFTHKDVISKSNSLRGILEPFSTQGNIDLLKRAGFSDLMTIMKYVCFEGFLAIK